MLRKVFDWSPYLEVRGRFLDISKAFDKVCHDGPLNKLKSNGTNDDLLRLLDIFLVKQVPPSCIKPNRYHRVVLNETDNTELH